MGHTPAAMGGADPVHSNHSGHNGTIAGMGHAGTGRDSNKAGGGVMYSVRDRSAEQQVIHASADLVNTECGLLMLGNEWALLPSKVDCPKCREKMVRKEDRR